MSISVPSKYIVFEGTDGSGKTTLSQMVAALIPGGKIITKEPGSEHVQLCIDIREEILNASADGRDPTFYAYLFAADTKLHMEKVVKPALETGHWVISDRSVMSDYAYRPRHGEPIRRNNFLNFMRQHPIVFFIDTDPDTCASRMEERDDLNEFEKAHVLGKIAVIRDAYLSESLGRFAEGVKEHEWPAYWYNIDNNGLAITAFKQIVGLLSYHFPEFTEYMHIGDF